MKTVIDRANTRGHADYGWLNTWHTFSFADYYNPQRIHFGALRVLNDDTVTPGMGFDTHPHKNMEVIWIIPRVNNTKPVYKSYDIRQVDMKNRFGYIVAPDGTAPGGILQDAWFALGKLEKGKKIGYHLHQKNTGVYCFVIEGEICIEGTDLSRRDGMGITETDPFQVEARSEAYVLLIEVAMI